MIDQTLNNICAAFDISCDEVRHHMERTLNAYQNKRENNPMTEYTDNKWITRDIPDPENAKPIEVTDYLGNRIGNGFVSPETGKLCIDCSQQKTNDIAIKSVEFYLGKKLMVGMSMAEWNPVVTIPPPFDKAVITTSQKGISIILFDESVRTAENEQAR